MLKNKLYDSVKTYLDKYLFGFDKSQLEMSVLKGNINLTNVNVKPNKANKFLQSMMVPFALKAGTIGRLELKVSILQMWNGPVEIIIDDLFIILGPNYSMVSHDDSYIEDDEQHMEDPYDSSNMFNIFEHQLKLRKKDKNEQLMKKQQLQRQNTQEQTQTEKQTFDFLKNMKLLINKVHIRYEDDVFNGEFPFSCGIVIDKLTWESTDQKWKFESAAQNNPSSQKVNNDPMTLLKNCMIQNFRLYWNCMSEMYIPTSLWESTRHLKYQIFEAMEISDLRGFLLQPFNPGKQNQFQYLISSTTVTNQISYFKSEDRQNENIQASFLFTPFEINVTPRMVEDMNNLVEQCQNYFLSKDLKQYRPHRRPLTNIPNHLKHNPVVLRKKKLLVRDWFFYVVWFVRLKRILRNMYSTELLQQELEGNSKYSEILKILENPNAQISDLKRDYSKKQDNEVLDKSKFIRTLNIRCQSIKMNLYTQNIFEATHPKFQIESSSFSFENYHCNHQQNVKNITGYLGELQISALMQKNKRDFKQIKQSILSSSVHENDNHVSSFIGIQNKTPVNHQDQYGRQNVGGLSNIQQNKNQMRPNNQLNAYQIRNIQSPPIGHQSYGTSQQNNHPMVSPQQKQVPEEQKSLFGTVLSKVFGFGNTPDVVEKKQPELTQRKSDNTYEQKPPHFNDQYYQQSNGLSNHQNFNNCSQILKQRSSRDIQQQPYTQTGHGQLLNQHSQQNIKNGLNSSRQGSGFINGNKVNSASKPDIDLNELKNDPIHQFLMSDLSIKDLKSNLDNINQGQKAQRVQSSEQTANTQRNGSANIQQNHTPQQHSKLMGGAGQNNHIQNNQMYKGLRDFGGKSQSQNNIPLPQNKKQISSGRKEIDQQQQQLNNCEIYKEISTTEVVIKQRIFVLSGMPEYNNNSIYIYQSKTIPESSRDKSDYRLETQIGQSNICYSNESLGSFLNFIIEYQKLNVFRDIQIIHQFFESSQRRQTSAQRRLELIMPFYIIRKLVQNHQTGKIKELLGHTNQAKQQQALSQWEQKLNTLDDQFRNFFFDISFQVGQSSIQLLNDNEQQFCRFTTPPFISGTAYKHNHECGFDVLGFNFQGCNNLTILSTFFHNLFNHINMMKQHPAIARGVDFYENLHKNLKEKQYQNKRAETEPNLKRLSKKNQDLSKQASQTKLNKYKQGPKANNDENKNLIKIENNHLDPSTSKLRGGSDESILQDFSNTPDHMIFFNRGGAAAGQNKNGLKQNLQLNLKNSSVIQNYNGNSADTIKIVARVEQDPVYLQTEEYDEDDGEPVFINDLDNLEDESNQHQVRHPQTLNLQNKNTIYDQAQNMGSIGHNSAYPTQSNYSSSRSKILDSHSINLPSSTISTNKSGLPPQTSIREINHQQPSSINNQATQKELYKAPHQLQQQQQHQQKKGMPGQLFAPNFIKSDTSKDQQQTANNHSIANQFSSTGTSSKTLMNTGSSSSQNQTSAPGFMGMVGRPMKTMNQIPSKTSTTPSQLSGPSKPGFSQGFASINNHLQQRQR